ncbi:hypothetical protein [Streptomyces sp. NPDC048057]|uniref:hypothetical protein n=1 Tax=Streptomyces sp. NPDC048057 TaxID=3155628 RepID=UPI00340574CD
MQHIADYLDNHPELQGGITDQEGSYRVEMSPVLATPAVVARTVVASVAAWALAERHNLIG